MEKQFFNFLKNNEDFLSIARSSTFTQEQLWSHRVLIEQVLEERQKCYNSNFIPTLVVGTDGLLYKKYVQSEKAKSLAYRKNIVTQHITKINLDIDLGSIEQTPERRDLGKCLEKIVKSFKDMRKGLYIYGHPGRGKTFVSQALANWFAKKGFTVGFINTSNLISYLKSRFNDTNANTNVEGVVKLLKSVDYLFIDDIGAETMAEWFRDQILFSILSDRMNNQQSIFYTSNYSYNQLSVVLSANSKKDYFAKHKAERLMERIRATSVEITLRGKNYRY